MGDVRGGTASQGLGYLSHLRRLLLLCFIAHRSVPILPDTEPTSGHSPTSIAVDCAVRRKITYKNSDWLNSGEFVPVR